VIWIALGLAAVGLFLSAFFSGSETGFYRATRMRLQLDAASGNRTARGLLWLTNHPSMFVATTLVGNNLANYLTSFAIVMGTHQLLKQHPSLVDVAELIAPLALAPLLFVYGELLPKNLFLHAPNRLLRKGGPLFLVFVPLFLPVSALLWCLNKILARLLGESPETVRLTLARRGLQRALEEGHEAGILHAAQRQLARGIFALAAQPVTKVATPLSNVARARSDMPKEEICQLARRLRISAVPVEDPENGRRLVGYVRVIDLGLDASGAIGPVRPLLEIPQSETYIDALMRMQGARESLALVVNADGEATGIVSAERLREPVFRGGR